MHLSRVLLQVLAAEILSHVTFVKGNQCGENKVAVNPVQAPANVTGVTIISKAYKNSTCIWQITAPVGYVAVAKLLLLTFSDDNCDSEYLKVYDGMSTSDQLIKRYCKKERKPGYPVEVWFTGVNGRLELTQGTSDVGPSLVMNVFAAIKSSCNNTKLTASSKESKFTSPDYPNGFTPGLSCQWLIEAPPGKYMKLTFKFVNINICRDILEVYDGEVESPDDLLKKRCSFHNNRMVLYKNKAIYSYGQTLLVVFKTEKYLKKSAYQGFEAVYLAVDGGKDCGPGIANTDNIPLLSDTGKITSPGFPVSLPKEAFTCVWRLRAPKGQVIKVDLESVVLRGGFILDCKTDLELYTNIGPNMYEIGRFLCDTYPFRSLVSDGRRMEIKYEQEQLTSSRKQKGFNLEYSTLPFSKSGTCKANSEGTVVIQGNAGTISSPNYPSYHPTNMTCRWKITVTKGQVIEITPTIYQLDNDCNNQWIRIYDGLSTSSPELIKLCRGNTKTFFSSTNQIFVEFVTKENTRRNGFFITYAARMAKPKPYSCSVETRRYKINSETGQLASPRFPLLYPNNAFCYYKIVLPKFNYLINLTFTSFDIEPDDDKCDKDYLYVHSMNYKLAKICGKKKTPFSFISKNNEIEVRFRSDATGQYPGYEATFTSVQDLSFGNCTEPGKNHIIPLTASSGTIFSPRYPNYYPPNMQCTWKVQPVKDKVILLIFDDVWLERCSKSSVVIRDLQTQKIIARLCEYPTTPYVVFSTIGNGLQVEFTSEGTSSYIFSNKGFTAHYETVQQLPLSISCGQDALSNKLDGSSPGSIASYNYPLKYENNIECTWVISTSNSYRFKIQFEFMDIEPSPGCTDDYVEVKDGKYSFSDSLGKFCGSTKPDSFKSSESSIFVEFKTNGTGRYGGFKLSYEKTYNVRTIVLISVFSVVGVIGFILLLVYCIYQCCCKDDLQEPKFDKVAMDPTSN